MEHVLGVAMKTGGQLATGQVQWADRADQVLQWAGESLLDSTIEGGGYGFGGFSRGTGTTGRMDTPR